MSRLSQEGRTREGNSTQCNVVRPRDHGLREAEKEMYNLGV